MATQKLRASNALDYRPAVPRSTAEGRSANPVLSTAKVPCAQTLTLACLKVVPVEVHWAKAKVEMNLFAYMDP